MVDDIVRGLGYLMLGTRLRRIGEALQGDATRIAAAHGVTIQSSQYPFLAALDRFGAMNVGDMARAVGMTQPGVTRAIGQLAKLRMVRVKTGSTDRRERIISLTAAGRRQIELGKSEVWPLVERAVADLCGSLKGPLLDQLMTMEKELAARPLDQRIKGGT